MPQRRSVRNPTAHVYQFSGSLAPWSAYIRWAGAVLVALLGVLVTPSWATDSQDARDSLRGLAGVNVLIERLEPEVERAGLTHQQLQTDVELRLQQSGIRVLTDQERRSVRGWPYVHVHVNVLLISSEEAVYTVEVALNQKVSLETGEIRFGATTWNVGMLGAIDRSRLSKIRDKVRDRVDEFINAYLSVNPRPAGSPPPASSAPPPAPQPAQRTR